MPPTTTSQGSQLGDNFPIAHTRKNTEPGKMASYIQLQAPMDGQDCNPTPQQRAVYSYYEEIHSDAADDIYSFEWFQRTKSFFQQLARQDKPVTALTTWEMVEDLDFGAFFLAHPVAAYSLWHLLQACYELDRVVCGTSPEEIRKLESWQLLKPFVYLKSRKIRSNWTRSLKLLKKEIECGDLEGDRLVRTLYDILRGVERLVTSSTALKDNFSVNLRDMKFVDEMLEKVARVVDNRCSMIADLLKLEDSQEPSRHESESSNEEPLGDSTDNLQSASKEDFLPIPHGPRIELRKRSKRHNSISKPPNDEIQVVSPNKPEQKYNSLRGFTILLSYAFLLIALGVGIYTLLSILLSHGLITPHLITGSGVLE